MGFFKESESRRILEKNVFIAVLLGSGLSLMSWSKALLEAIINIEVPFIKINVATIMGVLMIYLLYRYVKGRI